jgi:molecular chaperone Hsp33
MKKKKLYGETLKEQLIASARDRLCSFEMAGNAVRGAILNGTRMINEMRSNHDLGILETLVLGRSYLGAGLMASNLKGEERLSIAIHCSGPIKGLVVEANAFGEVRGYLKNVPIPIDKPINDFDLSPFFGAGLLSATWIIHDAKRPLTGQVALKYGNIARDLANYYLESEKIPSAFNLGIKFNRNGDVTGAGGLFLQAMPGTDDRLVADLESRVNDLPSLGVAFGEGQEPKRVIETVFKDYSPRATAEHRVEFMCHCNQEKVTNMLLLLPIDELKDIVENGPFPFEIKCHHCSTPYLFDKSDLKIIYNTRFSNN